MIYFDNAATTAMSEVAIKALTDISQQCYGNPSSIYKYGRKAKEIVEESRSIIANCIGAFPEEIFFTSGGTESDNFAIAQSEYLHINNIITSTIEHHAILHPVERVLGTGKDVQYIPVNINCTVDLNVLKNILTTEKTLVSVMFQNNETGTIQPIEEISRLVHEKNKDSIMHTDAVQAIGHINFNVKELGVDMLSASAHKFNGPKGVGFLYVRKDCSVFPFILGGGQEHGMRSGTENVAGIYAMAKALEENVNMLQKHKTHIKELEDILLYKLNEENVKYQINGDSEKRAVGIINLSFSNLEGEGLLYMLDTQDICISIGSACNSKSQDRSHVLLAMGLDEERIDASIRISIGRYNTREDIFELVKCIKRCWNLSAIAEV